MPVTTKLRVKQDYLLSMNQAQKAARGVLDPKKLLIKINLSIELQTKKDPNSAILMLLEKDVDSDLLKRSKEIETKISNFVELNQDKPALLEKKVGGYVEAVKGDFQKDVDRVVKERLKKVARDDQNLREARIVVGFKAVGGVVKLAGGVVRLASGDASALLSLANTIKDLAELALKALSTEQQRLKKLLDAKKELKGALDALEKAEGKVDGFWAALKKGKVTEWLSWKKKCSQTEETRKDYRNSVTKSRQKIEEMAKPLRDMEKAMKMATKLKEGVRLGSQVMTLKRSVRVALEGYQEKEKFLGLLGSDLKGLGVDVDDRTWKQKLTGFKKAIASGNTEEIVRLGKDGQKAVQDIYGLANDIKSLVGDICKLAA